MNFTVDEQIAVEAMAVKPPEEYTAQEMREMFHHAIDIQRDVILQAQNMIKHYEWALSEMAVGNAIENHSQ